MNTCSREFEELERYMEGRVMEASYNPQNTWKMRRGTVDTQCDKNMKNEKRT